ncbi:hypothetical protein ACOMHN_021738 [Nucella lapillus]
MAVNSSGILGPGAGQGNPFGQRMPGPAMGCQNEQERYNTHFDDGRRMGHMAGMANDSRLRPLHARDERSMGNMMGMGEPERLRPLHTSESYEENWNLPDNRRETLGRESYYDQEDYYGRYDDNRSFTHSGPFERQFDRFGQGFDDVGYDRQRDFDGQTNYDRQPYHEYDDRPQDRQPYVKKPSQAKDSHSQSQSSQSQPSQAKDSHSQSQSSQSQESANRDQHGSKPQQSSVGGQQEESSGSPSNPAPAPAPAPATKDQEGDKQEDDDDSDDDDTSFCKLCKVPFDNVQKYFAHTRGLLHTQRQMEADKEKFGLTEEEERQPQQEEQQKQPAAFLIQPKHFGKPASAQPDKAKDNAKEEEDPWEEEWGEYVETESNEFTCELCDIKTTGDKALRAHESGRLHKAVQEAVDNGTSLPQRIYSKLGPKTKVPATLKPAIAVVLDLKPVSGPSVLLDLLKNVPDAVVGTAFIKEGRSGKQPSFLCMTCESMCDAAGIMSHIVGSKHRMKYLRAHQATIYEHVRSHGGKKSQLSAFLEEVCADVEKKEGRSEPIVDRADKDTDDKKNTDDNKDTDDEKDTDDKKYTEKEGSAKDEKVKKKPEAKTDDDRKFAREKKRDKWVTQRGRRHLPHNTVMALYKEGRTRMKGPEGPWGPYGGRDDWRGPRGPRGPPPGPDIPPPWAGSHMDPYYNMPRQSEPYPAPPPPFMNFPAPYVSEETRLNRMYDYEAYLFDHPMLLVSPEEAHTRMFAEYERLGIPYDIACDRVLVQENRLAKIGEYMREGLTLKEAQARVRRIEHRKQLIKEYEQQGLDPREARWRALAEEERNKLNEKYESQGFTPLEARAKIMVGEDRIHLVQEFERHGMTPEEAMNRAVAEEDRLKNLEASFGPSSSEQNLDEVSDRRMLMMYIEQGDTKEQAENKAIAILRRQGVSTQEAILRVQKIDIKFPEKQSKDMPHRSQDEGRKNLDQERKVWDQERKGRDQKRKGCDPERKSHSDSAENLDNISPEEAKERLFQEYEKRGISRENARLALIQELIRSGVPEEDAKRRFSNTKPAERGKREDRGKRKKHSGRDRSRSRSRSSSSSRSSRKRRHSPSIERKKYLNSRQDDRSRTNRYDRYQHPVERRRGGKDVDRGFKDSRDRERSKEAPSRPTLTLGEELKRKAQKLKRAELLSSIEGGRFSAKQAKPGTSSQSPALPVARKDDKSVSELLESLTDNLISSKDNESEAMSMSKALTSALLKYRLNAVPDQKEKPLAVNTTKPSFMERRIQDAKKLFETKMHPKKEAGPSGLKMTVGGGDRRVVWSGTNPNSSQTVTAASFGLPPPLSANNPQQFSYSYAPGPQSGASSAYPPGGSSSQPPERKPIVPRVLLAPNTSSKGDSSSGWQRY